MRRTAWLVALAAAACGQAAPPTVNAPPEPLADRARTVTLLTGDRVSLARGAGAAVRVQAGPGRAHVGFLTQRIGDRTIVIPRDVAPLVASGQLDRDLFDVTALLDAGYSDAARDDLPLIVTGQPDAAGARRRLAGAVTVDRVMPVLHTLAVRQPKVAATALLDELTAAPGQRVWLDRPYKLSLDHSVPQIGGPAAAARGLTGTGAVVAVLDSGVDADHPDLAGKVADAQEFVGDGRGPSDVVGHGTHVASIIAGTGAASGGQFHGVAPGATLISARVCLDEFFCPGSALLAAMEWAVVTKHARIINLSLGAPDRAGVDPIEAAINRLSADFGALFVVAAGNSGVFGAGSLDSPGTADAALTVGAVDGGDALAEFSSRGPRLGDSAIKPDLTAPGVGIVAARAAIAGPRFGDPVGTSYTRLSGTSMATPHVAGAAAILLQQHPDWTGAQLKAALVGSSQPTAGLTAFEQGAGRVDVARAIRQDVVASPPSVSFGLAAFPHDDDPTLKETVIYRNDGAAPITLAITGALAQGATPSDMLTIIPSSLTLAPGEEANVTLIVETGGDRPDGAYSGALVATAGDVRIITPMGVEREVPTFNLTVEGLDSAGNPSAGFGVVFDEDFHMFRVPATLRLPARQYTVLAALFNEPNSMLFPRLQLTADTTVVMDGRLSRPIAVTIPGVPGPALQVLAMEATYRDVATGISATTSNDGVILTGHIGPPSAPGEIHSFAIATAVPAGSSDGRSVYVIGHHERDRYLNGFVATVTAADIATVRADHRADPDRQFHKFVIGAVDGLGSDGQSFTPIAETVFRGPFARTEHYIDNGFTWAPAVQQLRDFDGELVPETASGFVLTRYVPGRTVVEHWNRAPFGPAFPETVEEPSAARLGDRLLVNPSPFSEVFTPSRLGLSIGTARAALFRNGVLVRERIDDGTDIFGTVTVPPERSTYRFELDATRGPELAELSSRVTAAWTFTSENVPGTTPRALSLPTLRFAPELDDQNRALRLFPLVLPITVERPPGAATPAIARVTVDASFDDGATWSPILVLPVGPRYVGLVVHPRRASFVSLRGTARDTAGNRVEQTIIRAYKLAP